MKAMLAIARHAPDACGVPGEWGPWSVAYVAHGVTEESDEEPWFPKLAKAEWSQVRYRWAETLSEPADDLAEAHSAHDGASDADNDHDDPAPRGKLVEDGSEPARRCRDASVATRQCLLFDDL